MNQAKKILEWSQKKAQDNYNSLADKKEIDSLKKLLNLSSSRVKKAKKRVDKRTQKKRNISANLIRNMKNLEETRKQRKKLKETGAPFTPRVTRSKAKSGGKKRKPVKTRKRRSGCGCGKMRFFGRLFN